MSERELVGYLVDAAREMKTTGSVATDRTVPVSNPEVVQEAPRLRGFVGSSGNGKSIARVLQHSLSDDFDVTVWDQMVFSASKVTIESLEEMGDEVDFAILVVTPDDTVLKNGDTIQAARDNIIFEIGYFFGLLGRNRVFIVCERNNVPSLPTDLSGINQIRFRLHANGHLPASIGPAATEIRQKLGRLKL